MNIIVIISGLKAFSHCTHFSKHCVKTSMSKFREREEPKILFCGFVPVIMQKARQKFVCDYNSLIQDVETFISVWCHKDVQCAGPSEEEWIFSLRLTVSLSLICRLYLSPVSPGVGVPPLEPGHPSRHQERQHPAGHGRLRQTQSVHIS